MPGFHGPDPSRSPNYSHSYPAVADLDDDPNPEFFVVQSAPSFVDPVRVTCVEHDGSVKWRVDFDEAAGSWPAICDLDADGTPEIIVDFRNWQLTASSMVALKADGSIMWTAVDSVGRGDDKRPICFDFNGDGYPEIVHQTFEETQILSGLTGFTLAGVEFRRNCDNQHPIVADIDADGSAEIVLGRDWSGPAPEQQAGIYAYGNPAWKGTRPIWNQEAYHITNVGDYGEIPTYEVPSWQVHNTYHSQEAIVIPDLFADLRAGIFELDTTDCPNSVTIRVRVGNAGALAAPSGVSVALYDGDPSLRNVLGLASTTSSMDPGRYEDLDFVLSPPPASTLALWVVADDDGTGNGTVTECHEDNNACGPLIVDPCPSGCIATAAASADPACEGSPAIVDASASVVNNCPGGAHYRFQRNLVVVRDWDYSPEFVLAMPPGPEDVTVDVRCSSDTRCMNSTTATLTLLPDEIPPDQGNVLMAVKEVSTASVVLDFSTGPASEWRVYRDTDKTTLGTTPLMPDVSTTDFTDPGILEDGELYFYRIKGLSPCTKIPGP
ncbi:hypothetical protein ACFLU6_13660 [Acidobacteriota bacterium]